jgi:NADPH:quinone reductase-like Zn-dependent oxidoreductase
MKAIYYDRYGSPEVLALREVNRPAPKANEVLVEVRAASVNSWDWDMIRGKPWIIRLWGLTGPRYKIPGADIAGVVESVGSRVNKFKAGDEVFGDLCESEWGGFAEFTCAKESALALKPSSMSFVEAASLPQAGLMALQGLDQGNASNGKRFLMNGAGGGVGTFAIQIANAMGMHVTAVDSFDKLDALQRLGAHRVIDYRTNDFTNTGDRYDLIIDVVATRSAKQYQRALNSNGSLVIIGGDLSKLFGTIAQSWLQSPRNGKKLGMLPYRANDGLDRMIEHVQSGRVKPVIDSIFRLEQTADALRRFSGNAFVGKVMIEVK